MLADRQERLATEQDAGQGLIASRDLVVEVDIVPELEWDRLRCGRAAGADSPLELVTTPAFTT